MQVSVNGLSQETSRAFLGEFLQHHFPERRENIAVAVNGTLVFRHQWPDYRLTQGDNIDVVQAVAGG